MIRQICSIPPCPLKAPPARPVDVCAQSGLKGRVWKPESICPQPFSVSTETICTICMSGWVCWSVGFARRATMWEADWRSVEIYTNAETSSTLIINTADLRYSTCWMVQPMCCPLKTSVVASERVCCQPPADFRTVGWYDAANHRYEPQIPFLHVVAHS